MKPKKMNRKYSNHKWTMSDTERRLDVICLGYNSLEDAIKNCIYMCSESRIKTAWYRGRLGKLLRSNDAIAFEVIHNEWTREYEQIGTVMSKKVKNINMT